MGKKPNTPSTRAILTLRQAGVDFEVHPYAYTERGGTRASAEALGVDEHAVIKTLIMEDEAGKPLVVLQHGDLEVSTKALARALGCKTVKPCTPQVADRHSGYQVGGTSPFGTRKFLPVYMEASIAALDRLWINGGRRGMLVSMDPVELVRVLKPTPVLASQDG